MAHKPIFPYKMKSLDMKYLISVTMSLLEGNKTFTSV